jgi:hypothetical protein
VEGHPAEYLNVSVVCRDVFYEKHDKTRIAHSAWRIACDTGLIDDLKKKFLNITRSIRHQ